MYLLNQRASTKGFSVKRSVAAMSSLLLLTSASLEAVAQQVQGTGQAFALEEIVVTARRRDETLQDVPLTVNAVTAEQLKDLNIRDFEDLEGVVAGLTLQEDTIAPNASLRGVRFDTFISGNNPTVEFYLNDAPISSQNVMQALFDVSQIEVLRGPQGTLRGRASPSGAITVTTQRPILDDFGGFVDVTATDRDSQNIRAALNVPLIENVLAVRVAGFWEENNVNDVKSAFSGDDSEYRGEGYRVSLAFEPTDTLAMNLMYQRVEPDRTLYQAVESAHLANASLPASGMTIEAEDRLAVQDVPQRADQILESLVLQASWEFGGHSLNYVGSMSDITVDRLLPDDDTNALDSSFPNAWQGAAFAQNLESTSSRETHEIRLQSVEPLFDNLDYVVGALYSKNEPESTFTRATLLDLGFFQTVNVSLIDRIAEATEKSVFANLTYHLGAATEISAGLRRIDYEDQGGLLVGGVEQAALATAQEEEETIYSFSVKHDFSDDLMGYFSFGTSWRPGATAVGDTSLIRSPLQESFFQLPPEESDSYELGLKATWLDGTLRTNATVFHQKFDNFPYRSGGSGVYYARYIDHDNNGATPPVPTAAQHNFGAGVPVEVNGVELEAFYQISDNWDVGALWSYSKGEIESGLVPCNDYLPEDGMPDSSGAVPTIGQILAAAGSDNLTACEVTQRANFAPLWTGTLTSEYSFPLGAMSGYVRGLWTFYGDSKNDPTNSVDDVDSYNILNLYAGVRDPEGDWEVMIYGKNVMDTEEVLDRSATPGSATFRAAPTFAEVSVVSDYRTVSLTAPREFGLNFKYNF